MKRIDRIGETGLNNQGLKMTIIEYRRNDDVIVEFEEQNGVNEIIKCDYRDFIKGNIRCSYYNGVFNIGYIGKEKIKENNKLTKCYYTWSSMLERCYDLKFQNKQPTYKGCAVCEEWRNYSNFKKWYDENYYEIEGQKIALDKDILVKGNKIYYLLKVKKLGETVLLVLFTTRKTIIIIQNVVVSKMEKEKEFT